MLVLTRTFILWCFRYTRTFTHHINQGCLDPIPAGCVRWVSRLSVVHRTDRTLEHKVHVPRNNPKRPAKGEENGWNDHQQRAEYGDLKCDGIVNGRTALDMAESDVEIKKAMNINFKLHLSSSYNLLEEIDLCPVLVDGS